MTRGVRRRWLWATAVVVLILVGLAYAVAFMLDEPLRRSIEREMNRSLHGYSASIGQVSFHPLNFSLTLFELVLQQDSRPDPPVLRIPRLDASVQWRALLHRRVVADFRLVRPSIYVDRKNLEIEAKDPTPLEGHGWQEAFEAIYPLKINQVRVIDGEVTYVDRGPFRPLELRRVYVNADNIRNIRSREREYPSELHAEAIVFGSGWVAIDGNADFLAEPHLGVKASVVLEGIELDYFKPVTNRVNVAVSGGRLSAFGELEYAPTIKVVDLQRATIRDVQVEYQHTPAQAGIAQKATVTTMQATKQAASDPELFVRLKELHLIHSQLGILNRAANPAYRVFLSDTDLSIQNLSNRRAEGPAVIRVRGSFMGSGPTTATIKFQSTPRGPDVDLRLEIMDTNLKTLNDALLAHAGFDVSAGLFSLYSELRVRDGQLSGYVKPLASGVQAYEPEKDRDKRLGQRIYERLVTLAAKVLRNTPRKEVVTRIDVSGPVEAPKTNTWQAVRQALRNAFIEAIFPGFEGEQAGTPQRK